jgi:uncharacterized protein (TIGR02466 family)
MNNYFSTEIFPEGKPEWVYPLMEITNPIIKNLKENNKNLFVYHSETITKELPKFFIDYIAKKSFSFWEKQGYDLDKFNFVLRDCWVQEFNELGQGHHEGHIHWNNHVSGFYFLKCSDKSSYPIFHDPRPAKIMMQLPEKNKDLITSASGSFFIKPEPGLFVFFPAFLEHQFTLVEKPEPFRFIHFNGQFLEKEILNNK